MLDIYIPGMGYDGETEGDGGRHHEDRVENCQHYQDLPEGIILYQPLTSNHKHFIR